MKTRFLLSLLALVVLLGAPFGRASAAEATMPGHHPAPVMAGHCDDMPAQDEQGDPDGGPAVDCLVACSALAAAEDLVLAAAPAEASVPGGSAPPEFSGLHPEAEPPPPRLS